MTKHHHPTRLTAKAGKSIASARFKSTLILSSSLLSSSLLMASLTYPEAPRDDTRDTFHGVVVADPYRYMEEPSDARTEAWVQANSELAAGYLEALPMRETFRAALTEAWDYEKFGTPRQVGDGLVYAYNSGLQAQYVYHYVEDQPDAEPRLLLDPNTWSEDGTVSLGGLSFTDDGKLLAYSKSESGSDWRTWYVMDVATGEILPDVVKWSKFSSATWLPDNSGFFYNRYPEPASGEKYEASNENQRVFFHRLGTPQSEDILVFEIPEDPQRRGSFGITNDDQWLILWEGKGGKTNGVGFLPLADALTWLNDEKRARILQFKTLIPDGLAQHWPADFINGKFYTWTNYETPRGRLVTIDPANPAPEHWVDIIPESDRVLNDVSHYAGQFFVEQMVDATSRLYRYDYEGNQLEEVQLPGLGSLGVVRGKHDSPIVYYSFSSFNYPGAIFRLDTQDGASSIYRIPDTPFTPEDYTVEQVFYASKDGTQVPMFLVYRADLDRTKPNPVYLYGYGGFNVSLTPFFSITNAIWMDHGGIYAMPNLRGGGEYGKEWHKAGTVHNKQNVFDDFIAAAEYLIDEGYTARGMIGSGGGSNGGLLTGATMLQRPDLFGAVHSAVGVHDMLRYHKFTIGHAWATDYGTSDEAAEFATLLAYSPAHNVRPGIGYPPILLTTSDHDDRVVPAHTYKFGAALQAGAPGPNPVVVRIERKAGHGAGRPTEMIILEAADRMAFMAEHLGMGDSAGESEN